MDTFWAAVGLLALCVGALCFVLLPAAALGYGACSAKARAMGMAKTWGPLQGCVIEVRPGEWIPLENYRGAENLK